MSGPHVGVHAMKIVGGARAILARERAGSRNRVVCYNGLCAHSMFQLWRRSRARCKKSPMETCATVSMWVAGCAFAHDQARERQEHVRELAGFWAEAVRFLGIAKRIPRQNPKLKCLQGVAGSSWPGEEDTTSTGDTTVAKAVVEDRPPGPAKRSASTASELAVPSGEAGSARPGEKDTTNADVTAVARPAGEARPLGIEKQKATESAIAVSSFEAGPSGTRAIDRNSAGITAVAMPAGDARSPGIAKQKATDGSHGALMMTSTSCCFTSWNRRVSPDSSRSCVSLRLRIVKCS